jgi:hypothetical protein
MSDYGFSVRVDKPRNVMYITQWGQPNAGDLRRLKDEFLAAVVHIRPGFTMVNDQRQMKPFDEEAMEVAKELVAESNKAGLARVIRIVPASLMAKVRLSRTLVSAGFRYEDIRVGTPEEAEELLAEG